MAAKSRQYAYDLLRLILNATSLDKLAEDNSVDGVTQFYLALHTADPGDNGSQASSETNYVDYARQAINRTAAAMGCTLASPSVASFVSDIIFPDIGAASAAQTLTHWSLGFDAAGAGEILFRGPIAPTLPIASGQSGPILAAGTTITEV